MHGLAAAGLSHQSELRLEEVNVNQPDAQERILVFSGYTRSCNNIYYEHRHVWSYFQVIPMLQIVEVGIFTNYSCIKGLFRSAIKVFE